ncbi:MAG: glycosyl transferase family protein [Marinobacter sp.]|nr:glycosyl transferase family protein [Marinobacter sp.]
MPLPENTQLPQPKDGEHPFAPYVRILGKGKKGSRSLTREEARHALGMILAGQVEPVQLGAFLMLIRVKEETPDELAGFVEAVKDHITPPASLQVDIDWSSYAGKRRHAPWFLFSILLLAEAGLRTFVHGAEGHTAERLYLSDAMSELGLEPATDWAQAEHQLTAQGFSYLPLRQFSPGLADMIDLRPTLGLRSPVHSLARLINPLNAPLVVQGIFHPPYLPLHQEAGALLGYRRLAVIKGEGGEIERNPDNAMVVHKAETDPMGASKLQHEEWPALFPRRHVKPADISMSHMRQVWRGEEQDEYGIAAVVSTAALALKETGKAASQDEALALAESLWATRNKTRFD